MVPNQEEILEQVEKICQSDALEQSEHLKAFLRYVVLQSVRQPGIQPKEYAIATEVFGRDPGFDPRQDALVRVQAARLRSKLRKYYDTQGKGDRLLIDLPKGHYSPTFAYAAARKASPDAGNGAGSGLVDLAQGSRLVESEPLGPSLLPGERPDLLPTEHSTLYGIGYTKIGLAALGILSLVLGYAAFYYRAQLSALRDSTAASKGSDAREAQRLTLVWKDFVDSSGPILVTYSNTAFLGTPQQGLKYYKPLAGSGPNSGSHSSQEAGIEQEATAAINDQYTGTGEVMAVNFLGGIFWKMGRSFRVKRSLLVDWEDIKTGNIVILGSTAENLFLRDLPQPQDFVFRADKEHDEHVFIVNQHPKEGEQPIYASKREGMSTRQIVEDYALVSLLKGLDGKSKLMILAGLTTTGTQAAAEYVTNPAYIDEMTSHIGTMTDPGHPSLPEFYQVVIKAKVNDGVPVQIEYVTHHVL
jgi:hypothetical protein